MEQLTATLTQMAQDILKSLQPILTEYIGFLLVPMVVIIALTHFTKGMVKKVKNPKLVWRLVPMAYAQAYIWIAHAWKPETLNVSDRSLPVRLAVVFGVGVVIGVVNIALYDGWKWWRKRNAKP